jgi:predicted ATPase
MKHKDQPHKPFLRRIALERILSFGPSQMVLELENLNVLIGPNASGKSNLIEALSLIRATPVSSSSNNDLRGTIRRGGGARQWLWKGESGADASIDLRLRYPKTKHDLRHILSFKADEQGFRLVDETISYESQPTVRGFWTLETANPDVSILAQLRDPKQYPEISYLADAYEKIRIYRDWTFGRNSVFRAPQPADMRNDRLEEDFSNLGLFLSRLRKTPKVKTAILIALKDLYEGVTDFEPVVEGGTVQVFFTEGDFSVPATRLSDGTLRYLCLLAILCDPDPPPLICIEEPELGLHPDILPKLADLLVQASLRTQLIVTTHSDVLIDALTDRPEAVVVCEKHEGETKMHRLGKKELAVWLDKYRLGQLWTSGQIGGTRW